MTHTPQVADRLTADQAAAARLLADSARAADGTSALDEQTLLRLDPGSARSAAHLLLPDDDGTGLAGYAQVADGSAELVVAPTARRAGRGRALLAAVKEADPAAAIWAHGDLPAARALAASASLTRTRELLRMGTTLGATTRPEPPAGVRIETFDPAAHAEAWVRLNASAFASHPEQGSMTVADLRERENQTWFDPSLLLLAFDDGADAPIGFIWMKPGETASEAELYVLGIDPSAQGRGIGRLLTDVGLAEVAERGRTEIDLYVEGDNAPALATYRRAGFDVVERHAQYS
jgi:mycothiol synthase